MIIYSQLRESADYIRHRINSKPDIALILGSGWGGFTEVIKDSVCLPYSAIPNFCIPTVAGHKGVLVAGRIEGKNVIALSGRFHYYEGYSMKEVAFPAQVMALLGVKNLIVTNAAGAINESFSIGDLMLIEDHIKFFSESPLRGKNIHELGERFNDMTYAYSPRLKEIAREAAKDNSIDLKSGVYAFMPGPSFETPAEIRMLKILGVDAVGMSTVAEVIAANHAGMNVLGLSCITNMAAGITGERISADDVNRAMKLAESKINTVLKAVIEKL